MKTVNYRNNSYIFDLSSIVFATLLINLSQICALSNQFCYFWGQKWGTMKLTNGEFVETCHSSLRQSEERHGLKVKRKLGTPMHMQKSLQSLVIYNSKRAGHITPIRLKKKSLSARSPNTTPPFSKRFLQQYPHILDLHNIVNKKN